MTLEHQEIIEGNFEFPRKVFKKASVNNIVCARGSQLQDTDFWIWASNYLRGNREKKTLMLIQFTNISGAQGIGNPALPNVIEYGTTFPGRAWLLKNCSPGRYKVATDFDASQGAISIHELEIVYEFFTEFNTGQ
jgi:phage tail-like protein